MPASGTKYGTGNTWLLAGLAYNINKHGSVMEKTLDNYSLLKSLFRRGDEQFLEWSIAIRRDHLEYRRKPTMYVHPSADGHAFDRMTAVLQQLDCPRDVLSAQTAAAGSALYQGLRIPDASNAFKCLYLHAQGQSSIRAYRWQDKRHFEEFNYHSHHRSLISEIACDIHPDLSALLTSLKQEQEFSGLLHIWTQVTKENLKEIYLSFPSRPSLSWIAARIQPFVSNDVYAELFELKNLRFRNIGFDAKNSGDQPAMTVYFTLPLHNKAPDNDKQTVSMTHEFN